MCGADEKKVTDFISLLMFALLTSVVISLLFFPPTPCLGIFSLKLFSAALAAKI